MKHLKQYETINEGLPTVGDFVICAENISSDNEVRAKEFTQNNIGQLVKIEDNDRHYRYRVKYENVPYDISYQFMIYDGDYIRPMTLPELTYWSKDKNELLPYITVNKYNL